MKTTQIVSLSLALVLPVAVVSTANANESLKTVEQKASYTLASDLAKEFKQQGLNIDTKAFMLGLDDALNDRPAQLTDDEMLQAITSVKKQMLEKQKANRKQLADSNSKKGQAYLAENAKKEGVTTLESGIQYKVIKSGEGKSPTEDDIIFAHYEGKFLDGKVFDSSFERGTPLKFNMTNMIKGWAEIMKIMKPGDKWEVVIPSSLAYGEKGAGDRIGPNETLVFIIELIQFDSPK